MWQGGTIRPRPRGFRAAATTSRSRRLQRPGRGCRISCSYASRSRPTAGFPECRSRSPTAATASWAPSRGVYDPTTQVVRPRLNHLAKGDWYSESRDYVVTILQWSVNSTDRSRLLRVAALRRHFSGEQLRAVRFYECYVDLDHDDGSVEHLLYVFDPVFCGTGGCKLFVVDGEGRILSGTTVVKLPIYTTRTSREEEQNRNGALRHLYVWSQGMRRLEAVDGRYPRNASTQPRVLERQLLDLPEYCRLLMGHPKQ